EDLKRARLQDLVHPDDREESDKLLAELAGGEHQVLELERRYLGAGGDLIWAYEHISIMRDVDGSPHLVALVTDRTERLKHEQELAIAVERSKIAQHSAKAALYELLPRTGQIQFDASITAVTGFTPRETTALSDARRALVHPDDAPTANAAIDAGLRDGSGYDTTYRLRHKDGHYIWVHDRASLLKGRHGSDDRVIGMLLDISEQKAREEHINLLLREVNHRSKNMLGLVQAIARQTASAEPHQFLSDFSERIQALSANQDLLVRNDWNGVGIRALVSAQLAHLADGRGKRIVTGGPDLRLSPAAAQVLGMALHELATNASKYGALANEDGRIHVRWQRQDDRFSISWREEDGPEVVPPARQGFGTTVLRAMAAMSLEAEVNLSYPASGLNWSLSCPLSKVMDTGKAASSIFAPRAVPRPTPERRARILVVEDEALIAMEIVDILASQGYGIVGPTRSVEQALALFREYGCDMAVLDVNLGAQTAEPIVKALAANAIPYLLVSGYDRAQQPTALRASPLVTKPIRPDLLVAEVRRCLAAVAA
ncbi:MAG: PAS domain S-box protein, partial [Hyphomicrobiales bacterium]